MSIITLRLRAWKKRLTFFALGVALCCGVVTAHATQPPTRDTTPPSLTFTGPREGARVTFLPWVGGWVRDNEGGSGVARVQVSMVRRALKRTFYWGGSDWGESRAGWHRYAATETFWLNATIQGARWRYAWVPTRTISVGGMGAPQYGPQLFRGSYTIIATAYDRAGNRRSIIRRVRIAPDTTLPRVGFTRPARGRIETRLPRAEGWVSDQGGSGLERVMVLLTCRRWKRYAGEGTYAWREGRWQNAYGNIAMGSPATLTHGHGHGRAHWRWNESLPQGKDLPPGTYTFWVFAFDRAGNRNGLHYRKLWASPGEDSAEITEVSTTRKLVVKAP